MSDTVCEEMRSPEKETKKTYSILYGADWKKIGDSYELGRVINVLANLGQTEFQIKLE